MKMNKIMINDIPAIIWGNKSDKVYIHIHGKMSCKENAEDFAEMAESKGYQTVSFDLPEHGERMGLKARCDIWNGKHDLLKIADFTFSQWKDVSVFACSIGAYFCLNAYADKHFSQVLFQSPVLDMDYLINRMFDWFDVTEERLREEKEIMTPIDLLSWDYYEYVKSHPVNHWDLPTRILYGSKDNLQSPEVIKNFSEQFHCGLTIAQNSEHPFMKEGDAEIVNDWLLECFNSTNYSP